VSDALWITEADVVGLVTLGEAVAALERGLALEAAGQARNMVKAHLSWQPKHDLHAVGASLEGAGLVGTKTWCHTPGGATPLLLLFDAATGALAAVIEAFALGQLRTSGISGVATDRLATPGTARLGIAGTGKQALAQVAAVAAVRPVEHVAVYGRDPERRQRFAARIESELGLAATTTGSAAEMADGATILTLVTRAAEPFLTAAMPGEGTHVNAVGAIAPDRIEFEPALLDRCAVVAVDSPPQAERLSRELIDHYGPPGPAWSAVTPLSTLVADGARRPDGADLTLFKALGMGISDLTLGLTCLERARAAGVGRPLPQPVRAQPRLRAQVLGTPSALAKGTTG
jgi:ornithine cyclodeaminase